MNLTRTTHVPSASGEKTKPSLPETPASIRSRQSPIIAVQQMATHLFISAFFWPIFIVIILATFILTNRYGEIDSSHMTGASQALIWFPFSVSIGVFIGYFNPYLAAGVTRRVINQGFVLAVFGIAAVQALIFTGLFYLEKWIFQNEGWEHVVRYGKDDAEQIANPSAGGVWAIGIGMFMIVATAMISGHLVGMVFTRFKALIGIITIPITVIVPNFLMSLIVGKSGGLSVLGYIDFWKEPFEETYSGFILGFALLVLYILMLDRVLRITSVAPGAG